MDVVEWKMDIFDREVINADTDAWIEEICRLSQSNIYTYLFVCDELYRRGDVETITLMVERCHIKCRMIHNMIINVGTCITCVPSAKSMMDGCMQHLIKREKLGFVITTFAEQVLDGLIQHDCHVAVRLWMDVCRERDVEVHRSRLTGRISKEMRIELLRDLEGKMDMFVETELAVASDVDIREEPWFNGYWNDEMRPMDRKYMTSLACECGTMWMIGDSRVTDLSKLTDADVSSFLTNVFKSGQELGDVIDAFIDAMVERDGDSILMDIHALLLVLCARESRPSSKLQPVPAHVDALRIVLENREDDVPALQEHMDQIRSNFLVTVIHTMSVQQPYGAMVEFMMNDALKNHHGAILSILISHVTSASVDGRLLAQCMNARNNAGQILTHIFNVINIIISSEMYMTNIPMLEDIHSKIIMTMVRQRHPRGTDPIYMLDEVVSARSKYRNKTAPDGTVGAE